MHSDRQIYLPTEIVVEIVRFVAADEAHRQRTLWACCLLSHQWYSAAISLLYEKPRVDTGNAFQKFTTTVCPPIGIRRNKVNLGGLVRRLDLSRLVHHSSNSLTARLLGRVKENLQVFIAPRVSFSVNSLPALSKCHNLRHLDLALVADSIPFVNLEKALSHLQKLVSLRLPRSTSLTVPESAFVQWPPRLTRLQLSGSFAPSMISSFSWPTHLTSLTLKNCDDLSVNSLGTLMSSPQLDQTLKRLTISYANRGLQPESINAIPAFLPGLTFLSVPGDLVEETFFDILCYMKAPLSLRVLEFGYPCNDISLSFSNASLIGALDGGLANLRAVGFADVFCTEERIAEDEEIDLVLEKRALERATVFDGAEDDEEVGVYYL